MKLYELTREIKKRTDKEIKKLTPQEILKMDMFDYHKRLNQRFYEEIIKEQENK